MPTRPVILANGVALSPIGTAEESEHAIGDTLALTLQSTTGYDSFAWRLIGRPAESAATLSAVSGFTSSLTTDVAGEYRVQGVATGADGTSSARVSVVVVRTPNRGLRKVDRAAMAVDTRAGLDDLVEKWNESLDTIDATTLVNGARSVVSRAALRALDVSTLVSRDVVNVGAAASAGDGWAGAFYYDAGSAASDDGALTIAPNSGSGRFRRIYTGPVDVRWFGAMGDGVTDDAPSFQAALDSLGEAGGGVLFVPSGIYKLGSQLTVTHDNVEIRGDGRGTQINKVFAGGAAIRFLGVTSWRLRDLYVQCLLDTTGTGVGIDIDGSSHGLCEGVRVYNTRSHGIRVAMTESGAGAYYNEFRGCHVFNATGAAIYCGTQANQTKISGGDYTSSTYGLWAEDCESINCSGASLEGNATAGARVGTFGGASAGVNFSDCRFESAGVTQYGVWIDHASSYVSLKGGFPGGELAEIHNPRSSPYLEVGGFNPPSTTPAEGRYAYGLQTARGARFAGMTWTNDGAGTTTGAYAATLKVQTTGANPLQLQSASGYVELLSGGLNFVGSAGRVCANLAASTLYLQGSGSGGVVVEGTGAFQTASSAPMQAGGTFRVVGNVGFYGASPQAKPTVSGSRGGNAALQSLLAALSTLGLITDSTS